MSECMKGRATTDEAKRHIIERLYALWVQFPDLRLGQLICNIDRDPIYREDGDLMAALEQGYAVIANGPDALAQDAQAPYAEHYKGYPFEPVDIAEAYALDFNEGNVVKYLLRWRKKDGLKDLLKAKYYIERLISLEERRLREAGE